jgi:hypothetical protein
MFMDSRLTTKEFLRVFERVRSTGERIDQKFRLGEMYAWHDYDGYTCWLNYRDITVTLMFHGSLKIECDRSSNYTDFTNQCLSIITAPHYNY